MKIIEVLIDATGKATVQTKGFVGSSCQEASRFIEQALGNQIAEQRTTEFYRVAEDQPLSQRQ
jgi:hypothetical protein